MMRRVKDFPWHYKDKFEYFMSSFYSKFVILKTPARELKDGLRRAT